MTSLAEALDRLPRLRLAQLPTPLQMAPRLTKALGGPTIYFKRDDLTGNPLGGNKSRMFEFVLPRALAQGADCVVGGAAFQSNYCRQLTAACAGLGLDVYLVLRSVRPDVEEYPQGNLLLDLLMGARVQLLREADHAEQIQQIRRTAEQLKLEGRKPYVARAANDEDVGLDTAAYVQCALEMHEQFAAQGIFPTHVYVAAADTTQGGLELGARALGETYQIVGITPSGNAAEAIVAHSAAKAAAELGLDIEVRAEEVINLREYAGEGYARPSAAGLEAVRRVASLEGILLDPVYTGKAMAALMDHVRQGKLTSADTVVFLHTGGWPALFAYHHYFEFGDQLMPAGA